MPRNEVETELKYVCPTCGNSVTLFIPPAASPTCSNKKHIKVRQMVLVEPGRDVVIAPEVRTRRRRDAMPKAVLAWAESHVGYQVSAYDVADAVGWNYQGALRFMKDHVGLFHPVKRGLYEVRDERAERALAR